MQSTTHHPPLNGVTHQSQKQVTGVAVIFKQGNRGPERSRILPRVTQLVGGRAELKQGASPHPPTPGVHTLCGLHLCLGSSQAAQTCRTLHIVFCFLSAPRQLGQCPSPNLEAYSTPVSLPSSQASGNSHSPASETHPLALPAPPATLGPASLMGLLHSLLTGFLPSPA